jgi:Tfp pilus assembly protein PilF
MMAEDLNTHLRKVDTLLASAQPAAALQAAEQGLSIFPYSSDLLNLAGLSAATLGDFPRAERYWLQSIELEPASPRTLFNLALINDNLQRRDQAERYYRRALKLDPDNAAAHSNLGAVLAAARDPEQAEQCYRRAIVLQPAHARAHYNLGLLLIECRRPAEAEGALRHATAAEPHHAPAWFQLGVLLVGTGRQAEAECCYRHSIALDPTHAMTYNNLGLLLAKGGRTEAAEQCYRMAFALYPDSASAFNNLGLLLETAAQDDEAECCYRRAIALEPQAPIAYSNLALLLARRDQDQRAEDYLRRAVAVDPDYAVARLNLGYLLLRQGRFGEGWHHHEARLDPSLPAENRHPYPANVACAPWRGEPLRGKSLLVWPEQGMGDEIQFCRYLPLLKRQGAARITLVCKTPLRALMGTLEGVDAIIPATAAAETPVTDHDYWTCPLSIPLHCRTRLATIPAELPYLRVPPERAAKWAGRLPRDRRLKVGLVWKGSALHHNDAQRSLPELGVLAPLWSVPDVQFISLQKERDEEHAMHPPAQQPLLALGHELNDFADSAAILAQLDLLISVDTAVAHLAGALARPCWVMLPQRRCDWRWLQGRDDSPWYPGVMRLFRQPREGDWETVVTAVTEALRAFAARRTPA